MMSAIEDIKNYVFRQSSNDYKKYTLNITKFRLGTILYDELIDVAKSGYISSIGRMLFQRSFNKAVERELIALNEVNREKDVKAIYVKGLPLAEDLYNPVESRTFLDIDILIDIDDVEPFFNNLITLGYTIEEDETITKKTCLDVIRFIKNASVIAEMATFKKTTIVDGIKFQVFLEVHASIFMKRWYEGVLDTRELITRSVEHVFKGHHIRLLEIHDRIIHLLVHFSFHCTYDGFITVFNGGKYSSELNRIHDVALVIDKYASVIHWEEIIDRSKRLSVCSEVVLALRILETIYPGRVPRLVLQDLEFESISQGSSFLAQAFPMGQFFPLLTTIDPNIIINTELSDLIDNVIPKYSLGKPELKYTKTFRLSGPLKVSVLEKSLNELANRHPILQTSFIIEGGKLICSHNPDTTIRISRVDMHAYSPIEQEKLVRLLIGEEIRRPFDLTLDPLLQATLYWLGEENYIFFIEIYHDIFDSSSWSTFFRELNVLYSIISPERLLQSPLEAMSSIDASPQLSIIPSDHDIEARFSYWRHQLELYPFAQQFPTDRPRSLVQSLSSRFRRLTISSEITDGLRALSKQENVTLFTTLLAIFKISLHRYTGHNNIAVATPISDSDNAKHEKAIGKFTDMLVLNTDFSGNLIFQELLRHEQSVVLEAIKHFIPFGKLVNQLNVEQKSLHHPPVQIMFDLQRAPVPTFELPDLRSYAFELEDGISQFDLSMTILETASDLTVSIEYNIALFDVKTITRLVDHFEALLISVIDNPRQSLSNLRTSTDTKARQLLETWNDTITNFHEEDCIHTLFEAQVKRTPDSVAVVFGDTHLTYAELNQRANQLGNYLRSLGIAPDALVGVCMERSVEMIIALLGVLKAGGAYVPLDPTYPYERLALMLEDGDISVILSQERFKASLPTHRAKLVCLDENWDLISGWSDRDLSHLAGAENLAYVIYTSGSTGNPKGAMNIHKAVCNRLLWMQEAYSLTHHDRVLQKTPFTFDVSVWEFFWPLLTGAQLIIAKPEGHKDSNYLIEVIREHQITTAHFVPSMLQAFLETPNVEACISLRRVICSGEALSYELQQRFFACLGADLHNLYGPTEAAVDVTHWTCEPRSLVRSVPIGRPIANVQIYLLDQYGNPAPVGVPGEIHIGGTGVGRGYLNRPDLTAEKFVPNPFSETAGARLYKTGDLARYQPDGSIIYLGRIDYQVKVRGHRIELGEIEAILNAHPGVREAVVVVREDTPGDQRLVAYITLNHEQINWVSDMRSFLRAKLPRYMMPSKFVVMDTMPLSSNGKVSRRNLPIPNETDAFSSLNNTDIYSPTSIDRALAKIWSDVLKVPVVTMNDNFFDLGGHSLLATQIISRVRDTFQVELSAGILFEMPTIAQFAQYIAVKKGVEQDIETTTESITDDFEEGEI